MKFIVVCKLLLVVSPAPQGAGGLKYVEVDFHDVPMVSRPARGGWIEILSGQRRINMATGPAPQGAGGLK